MAAFSFTSRRAARRLQALRSSTRDLHGLSKYRNGFSAPTANFPKANGVLTLTFLDTAPFWKSLDGRLFTCDDWLLVAISMTLAVVQVLRLLFLPLALPFLRLVVVVVEQFVVCRCGATEEGSCAIETLATWRASVIGRFATTGCPGPT